MITQDELKTHIHYDPITGIFTRLKKCQGSSDVGSKLGRQTSPTSNRHFRIVIKGKTYRLHRLAWLYVYGTQPTKFLDHINNDPTDNRLCNLREADFSGNRMNAKINVNNTSGYKGVGWNKGGNKWQVTLSINGTPTNLGSFEDVELAGVVAEEGARKFYREFARVA